jgi:hypothetical protein
VRTNGTDFCVIYNFSPKDPVTGTNLDGVYSTMGLTALGDELYGTAQQGGIFGYGTVFSLRLPMHPAAISAIDINPDKTVTLSLQGWLQNSFILQATTSLASPISWQPLATNVAGVTALLELTDTNANNYGARFYRLIAP